jgi:hypothetical protein
VPRSLVWAAWAVLLLAIVLGRPHRVRLQMTRGSLRLCPGDEHRAPTTSDVPPIPPGTSGRPKA